MVGDALDPSAIPTRESLELESEAQFHEAARHRIVGSGDLWVAEVNHHTP